MIILNTADLKEIKRQGQTLGSDAIDGIIVNYLYKGDVSSRNKLLYPNGTVVFASIVYFPSSLPRILNDCFSQQGIHDINIYIRGDGFISIKYMIDQYYYRRDLYKNGIIEVGYKEATSENISLLDNIIETTLIEL